MMRYMPFNGTLPSNCTCILPSWNAINQINTSLDLLIYNSGFKKVGALESMYTVPMIGADAFGEDDLTCGLDVYLKDDVILVQARSAVYKGKGLLFVKELVAWLKTISVSRVMIIGTADSARKPDGAQNWLAYVNNGFLGLSDVDGLVEIDVSKPSYLAVPIGNTLWPIGGGLTRWLFAELKAEMIVTGVLIAFCSEGDVKGIATHMADKIYKVLKKESPKMLKFPPSWTTKDKFVQYQTELYG